MIVFKYRQEPSGIMRPVADVIMKAPAGATGVLMYIDSGADISMIPRRTGMAMGFSESDGGIQEMRGIAGGGVPYLEKTVMIVIGGEEWEVPVAWALIEEVPPLLGRKGIFTRFKITFDETAETITFDPSA